MRKKRCGRIVLAAALLAAGTAAAQAYRWVDERGRVQFGDVPPPGAKDVRKRDARLAPPQPAPMPFELARLQKDFPVTLYSAPECKDPCDAARGALNRRGIPFREVQVWDRETQDELRRVSGEIEVPVLVVGRTVQRGFEPEALDLLLDSAGYPREGVLPARSQKAPAPPEGYVPPAERAASRPVAKPVEPEPAPQRGRYATPQPPDDSRRPGRYVLPGQGETGASGGANAAPARP